MMAKMKKSDASNDGAKFGREVGEASEPTLAELDTMGWEKRQSLRATVTQAAMNSPRGQAALLAGFGDVFSQAFRDGLDKAWGHRLHALQSARRNWQRVVSGMTLAQAVEKALALGKAFNIRGADVRNNHDGIAIDVHRGWSSNATIYVRFSRNWDREPGAECTNPDDPKQRGGTYDLSVEYSWASTGRTLAAAVSAIKVYQELTACGAELEARMSEEKVYWTWGIPEPEPVPDITRVASSGLDDDAAGPGTSLKGTDEAVEG